MSTAYTKHESDGLWSDEIFEILEDDRGYLWMSCTRGVFRVSKAGLQEVDQGNASRITSIAYGKADGMESIQLQRHIRKQCGVGRRTTGGCGSATTKGVVVTDPERCRPLQRKAAGRPD